MLRAARDRPKPEVAALFHRVASTYETVGPPFFDHCGALFVEHARVRRGERVVDLAAGSGAVLRSALQHASSRPCRPAGRVG